MNKQTAACNVVCDPGPAHSLPATVALSQARWPFGVLNVRLRMCFWFLPWGFSLLFLLSGNLFTSQFHMNDFFSLLIYPRSHIRVPKWSTSNAFSSIFDWHCLFIIMLLSLMFYTHLIESKGFSFYLFSVKLS